MNEWKIIGYVMSHKQKNLHLLLMCMWSCFWPYTRFFEFGCTYIDFTWRLEGGNYFVLIFVHQNIITLKNFIDSGMKLLTHIIISIRQKNIMWHEPSILVMKAKSLRAKQRPPLHDMKTICLLTVPSIYFQNGTKYFKI